MIPEPNPLLQGIALGFGAGISPGPTNVLVIHQTIKYGWREGLKVAVAPLITDVPIICLCAFIVAHVPNPTVTVAVLGAAGACYLAGMAVKLWREAAADLKVKAPRTTDSFRMGIITNFLNPGPWIHWLTIGMPLLAAAKKTGQLAGFFTIGGMLLAVVAGKILVALVAKYASANAGMKFHHILYRASAVLLAVFSVLFLRTAVSTLRIHA